MPFIALNKDTKERIDITTINDPRLTIPKGSIICQLCEQPMIIKAGQVIQAHFAHKVSCTSDYEHKPESAEHLRGKEKTIELLKKRIREGRQCDNRIRG